MRLVSFTFDDGLANTAGIIKSLDIPATFYIVTGWIYPGIYPILDAYNENASHGSPEFWSDLVSCGYDVGSHTVTHVKSTDPSFVEECLASFRHMKCIHHQPVHFSFPHGVSGFVPPCYRSLKCGGDSYNDIQKLDFTKITSLNPRWSEVDNAERPADSVIPKISDMPDRSWLVLTYHGINEGWMPITIGHLEKIRRTCESEGVIIASISNAMDKINDEICISHNNL